MPKSKYSPSRATLTTLQPNAAGADIGAREIYVAVPPDRSDTPVRCFGTFTDQLRELVAWMQECKITSVAMEATSVYWMPLADLLEDAKIEVCLVNPRHVKNVPGRKTDVQDCQWLQYLHSVGLWRAAFRPPVQVRTIRALWRHREAMVRQSVRHVQHIHKALDLMNVQIHHVISDITGVTGIAIIEAIIAGQYEPAHLASLRDKRIKVDVATLKRALTGDYRKEHLFCLRQAYESYQFVRAQIAESEREVERLQTALCPAPPEHEDQMPTTAPRPVRRVGGKNNPTFDATGLLKGLCGVDLTEIPGLSPPTLQTLWTELGHSLAAFPSAKHFASWLSLCPDNRISGGRKLSVATRATANRVAHALRVAAQGAGNAHNEIGDFHRRMRFRLGGAAAVTATAHKLARILYACLRDKCAYEPTRHALDHPKRRARMLKKLRQKAKNMGFQLVDLQSSA
ncbi:MAG: IS110 family transposase [Synoicihabitans sp.]